MQNRKAIAKTGAIVTVVSVTGGWTTIKNSDGVEQKVRNGALRDLTEMELSMLGGKAPAATKAAKPKADKPAKAAKEKAPEGDTAATSDKLVKPDYGRYTKHDTRSPSGRRALDIGDEAAAILRGQAIEDCYFIVAKNLAKAEGTVDDEEGTAVAKIEADLKEKYKHLNVGMQRMNLGNRLRKALGTYGNLNAHKTRRSTDEGGPNEGVAVVELIKGTRRKLKRSTDPKAVPA